MRCLGEYRRIVLHSGDHIQNGLMMFKRCPKYRTTLLMYKRLVNLIVSVSAMCIAVDESRGLSWYDDQIREGRGSRQEGDRKSLPSLPAAMRVVEHCRPQASLAVYLIRYRL
jgi:hypothetical protein